MEAYFDHNATSKMDKDVQEALILALKEGFANPSSVHALGRKAKARYLKAKDQMGQALKLPSKNIFFSHSASEAITWILHSGFRHIVSTNLEHLAVIKRLEALEKQGTKVTLLRPLKKGSITVEDLATLELQTVDCVILGAANSETGIIQDLDEVSLFLQKHHIPLIVDAVGILGKAPFNFTKHVTSYIVSSHKIHGPSGIAFFSHQNPNDLPPFVFGGYQENGKKAGTENVVGSIGFSCAFQNVLSDQFPFASIKEKRDLFEKILKQSIDVEILGEEFPRVFNTSLVRFKDISAETLLHLLDQNKIYASHGSACSSGALEPSRVIMNMGFSKKEASECIRFSFSQFTTLEEITFATDVIIQLAKHLLTLV
jgi:cysteine desulfurase